MADISRSRTIVAEPQAIWNVLADFGALSTWADGIDHSCVLNEGPDGEPVGTTRRVQVGRNTLVERITAFDPPTSLAYDIEGLPNRLRKVANHWRLRRSGNATIVDLTSTVEVGTGRLAQMAERVALRVLAKQSDAMLAGLASRLEKTHA
ncbi:SRPBCC family protein [Mycobacterium ulcerans]|uniref:SRPBCC family protein n=1 Tax=Mycobacterium ulcerans TaxID=1809 RepID=UPI000BBAA84A